MFEFNDSENIVLPGKITYSAVISPFLLFWEIEIQIYPKRKIKIRLKRK